MPLARACSSSFDLDGLVGEVSLHQVVVGDDDALDERVVDGVLYACHLVGHGALGALPGRFVVGHRGVGEQVDDTAKGRFLADRQLERRDAGTELRLQVVERPFERRPFPVELVHEHGAGELGLLGHSPRHLGLHLDAFDGRHDEHGEVGGAQGSGNVAHEVGVPGGVEDVHLVVFVLERGDGHRHRDPAPGFLGIEVRDGVAVLDTARTWDRAGHEEERFGEAGLPRSAVADQRDVTDLRRRIHLQVGSPSITTVAHALDRSLGPASRSSAGRGNGAEKGGGTLEWSRS